MRDFVGLNQARSKGASVSHKPSDSAHVGQGSIGAWYDPALSGAWAAGKGGGSIFTDSISGKTYRFLVFDDCGIWVSTDRVGTDQIVHQAV